MSEVQNIVIFSDSTVKLISRNGHDIYDHHLLTLVMQMMRPRLMTAGEESVMVVRCACCVSDG